MMKKEMIIMILFSTLVLSGCWNQKEMTDLAFVMAMGIDEGKDDYRYDVTFQIVIPGNVSSGQDGGSQGLPIVVIKGVGNTITEAAREATKTISRQLYYAHTNLLVINDQVAEEGVYNLLDGFERDPVFRTTTQVVVARKSKAEEVLTILTSLDKIPVEKITKTLKGTESMLGQNIEVSIDDFIDAIVSSGKEPVVSGFKVKGKPEKGSSASSLESTKPQASVVADGLAIFKEGKLTGWLDQEKARGAVWVMNKVKSTDVNIDWKGKEDAITIIPIRTKTGVTAEIKNGKPVIHVAIEEEGNLSEANTPLDVMDPKIIKKMEKKTAAKIKEQVETAIKAAQKEKSDIFGFGDKVHRADPKLWKRIKHQWDEEFASLQVEVKVNSYYRRSGVRTKPFWSDLDH
jgi:spore germination protein KC